MPMLNREQFNAATSGMNNRYDKTSLEVLVADRKVAEAAGDTKAMASIDRDIERAQRESGSTVPVVTPTNDSASGPVPELRAQLEDFSRFGEDLTSAIFGNEQVRKAATRMQAQYTTQQAQELAAQATIQADSQIAEDNVHRALLRSVGLDINDLHSNLNQQLLKEQGARSSREMVRSRITELQSVSFFENPFEFLMNQPELGRLVQRHNELVDVENTATNEITRMQSLGTTLKQLTPARDADLLRRGAQASANAVLAKAQAVAAEITAQNAAGQSKALLDAYTIRKNIFNDMMQLEQLEGAREHRQFLRDERKAKKEEQEEIRAQNLALVQGINLYRKTISGNVPDMTLEEVRRLPQKTLEMWRGILARGNYGSDYSESIPFVLEFGDPAAAANSGNALMIGNARTIEKRAMDMVASITNTARAQGSTIKMADALQLAFKQIYDEDRNYSIKGSDKSTLPNTSPYAFDWDSIATRAVAANSGGVVASVLIDNKTRAPGANLTASMTPRNFLAQVEAKVVTKQVDPKTAAEEVSRFFALESARNYQDAGLKYLGLPQMTDFVILPGATGKEKVDLMNPTQLENYFTAKVAADKRVKNASVYSPFDPFGLTK